MSKVRRRNESCQPTRKRTPRCFLVAFGPARLHSALGRIAMTTKTILLVTVATLLVVCACARRSPTVAADLQLQDSSASVTVDAAKFLHQLHEQGELPGLSKADHGELKASVSDFSEKVHFPVSLE